MKASLHPSSPVITKLINTSDKIKLAHKFEADKVYQIVIEYEAQPKQAMYFFENEVWTQGQGKETSHWLPSINDVNDKIIFNFSITAPSGFTVLANGKLKKTSKISESKTRWDYFMQHPMSSYLAAIVVGKFSTLSEVSNSGIPLEYYLPEAEIDKIEPTFRYTKNLFDFLEQEIGVSYPWQVNKQVAVRDFLHAGMENTTLTVFSHAFVVDSIGFNDRNYVNVNAHELAHHWFGNLVTAKSSEHHWLQEGFATYYALLAEREIFGEDYYYWKLYQSAEQLTEISNDGKGEPLIKAGASSLTYYQKGAWALHILRERIGDLVFKQAVQNYLTKHRFSSVTTDDFLMEIQRLTDDDLQWFKDDWLFQGAFRSSQALASLRKSPFIEGYLSLSAISEQSIAQKEAILLTYLDAPVNDYLGQEVVYQLANQPFHNREISLYKKAFQSDNLYTRQALATSLREIPEELKLDFETLLEDESYETRENAMINLWINFPEDRTRYLDKMKGQHGFQNKNLRQLWLLLSLLSEDTELSKLEKYFDEFSDYTNANYSFEIRDLAFKNLLFIDGFTYSNIKNLLEACFHHNWRFRNNSRAVFEKLVKNENLLFPIEPILDELPEHQKDWVKKLLKNKHN